MTRISILRHLVDNDTQKIAALIKKYKYCNIFVEDLKFSACFQHQYNIQNCMKSIQSSHLLVSIFFPYYGQKKTSLYVHRKFFEHMPGHSTFRSFLKFC